MCKFDNGLKLCTCDELSEATPDDYTWQLRVLDYYEPARGRCYFPSDDIGEGLEHQWIELNLNCENCFDFDYQPKEGDNLIITKAGQGYLSFMFRNNEWTKDFYNEIGEISKLVKNGKVKPV